MKLNRSSYLKVKWSTFRFCSSLSSQKKVNEPRNRPGVAQNVPGNLCSEISMIFGTLRRWGRQPHAPAAFTPPLQETFLVLIFTRDCFDPRAMVKSEGICHWKNPVTPSGIDLGTVRLFAQRLNHYATPRLLTIIIMHKYNHVSGVWGRVVVKALRCLSDGPGIDSRLWNLGFFSMAPPDGTMCPEVESTSESEY